MSIKSYHKSKAGYDTLVFATVVPAQRRISFVRANDIIDALALVGLTDMSKLDHGIVQPATESEVGYSFACHSRAIFHNEGTVANLFAVATQLCAGDGIVYAHSLSERSVDCPENAPIRFFASIEEVEAEIAAKTLDRPVLYLGDSIGWQWPQPAPMEMAA